MVGENVSLSLNSELMDMVGKRACKCAIGGVGEGEEGGGGEGGGGRRGGYIGGEGSDNSRYLQAARLKHSQVITEGCSPRPAKCFLHVAKCTKRGKPLPIVL